METTTTTTFELSADDLPSNFKHVIVETNENCYILQVNLQTEDDMSKWVAEFGKSTMTQWNSRRSRFGHYKISKVFVCHHSNFMKVPKHENKKGLSKNADCRAEMRIKIYVSPSKQLCARDPLLNDGLLAKIHITRQHTHTLKSATALRFLQDKDGTACETYFEYFKDNMTAAEAKNYHEHKLKSEIEFANGTTNPTHRTVSNWYAKWRLLNLGPRTGSQLITKLQEKITEYEKLGVIVRYTEVPFAVLILTPVMLRAHSLSSSRDLLFVDTTSACDSGHHSVTFLITPCAAGAVPLAVLIAAGQSTEVYANAFALLKNTLPDGFGKQGYPTTVLTDNSAAEISALKSVWPDSNHFLCLFHILQAVWRWLWDSGNGIPHEWRTELMNHFKTILRAENLTEIETAYANCIESGSQFPKWQNYVNEYWKFKEKWILAYRDQNLRGHHTNNFAEATIRIFKDVVLSRVKAYNVIALIDFVATTLEEYYTNKLRSFANFRKRDSYLFFQKNLKKSSYLRAGDIVQISSAIFLVPSESTETSYTVDVDVGSCTCHDGKHGKFCKHQCAVYTHFNVASTNFPPVSKLDRHLMAKVALGDAVPDISFYDDFEVPLNNENINVAHHSDDTIIPPTPTPTVCVPSATDQTIAASDDQFIEESDQLIGEKDQLIEQNDPLIVQVQTVLAEKIYAYGKGDEIKAALKKYLKHLQNITSEGLLLKFLHTAPITLRRFKSGTSIRVQPTSIARRKPEVTRGCKKVAAGRIAKELPNQARKKQHRISTAISENTAR